MTRLDRKAANYSPIKHEGSQTDRQSFYYFVSNLIGENFVIVNRNIVTLVEQKKNWERNQKLKLNENMIIIGMQIKSGFNSTHKL